MKLFELKNWVLHVREEAWGISAFKALLDRDKTKEKEIANKEMLFIYFFCDIKSDYQYLTNEEEREEQIRTDIGLPKNWKVDKTMREAMKVYQNTRTVIETLYMQSLKSAQDVGNYLANTDALLKERDMNGKVVTDIAKITGSLEKVPKIMTMLKAAYKEVLQEQKDNEGKQKGSKQFNTFEDGFRVD